MRIGKIIRHALTVSLALVILASAALAVFVFNEASKRAVLKEHRPSICLKDRNNLYLDDIENPEGLFGFWDFGVRGAAGGGIPPLVVRAILSAEDKDFYDHPGVDPRSVFRALWQNIRHQKRLSGASTIAMQVVRMENPDPSRDRAELCLYWNKLVEMAAAIELVRKYGHDAVLRHYLRIAPFGNRCHGIVFAAEKYFSKPLKDLTLSEICVLAAIPRAPGLMDLYSPNGRARAIERACWILGRMKANGYVSGGDYRLAQRELGSMRYFVKDERPVCVTHALLKMRQDPAILSSKDRLVLTSLDLQLQKRLESFTRRFIELKRPQGANNAAVIVADIRTGEILAYIGSTGYNDREHSGSIDYACTPRSSGSILKPFLYALGMIDLGYTGATVLSDIGTLFPGRGGVFIPENSDRNFEGPVLYRTALANSRNIPAVQLLNSIGINETYDFFRRLGLVSNDRPAEYYGLGLAIGGLYIRLCDLVRAYGVLAADGRDFKPGWICHDPLRAATVSNTGAGPLLVPSDIARMITLFLSDPIARIPTFQRLGNLEYPFPVAIKTGTSQGCRDGWAVAYTEKYVVGAWVGDPSCARMNNLGGVNTSAVIIRMALSVLQPREMEGLSDTRFMPPDGYIPRQICTITGKLATEYSLGMTTEWFKPGTEPTNTSDVFRPITVDRRTGAYPAPDCPAEFLEQRVVAFLPPQYAEWAKYSGLELPPFSSDLFAQADPRDPDDYKVSITEPADGLKFTISPAVPLEYQTIPLKASINPPVEQAVWYVDGRPYRLADFPYTIRWKLTPGRHTFQVRFPYARFESRVVSIIVE